MKQTSAELKRRARESLRGYWGMIIGVSVLMNLIVYAAMLPFYIPYIINQNVSVAVTYSIAVILISLASVVLQAGITGMQMKVAKKQQISIGMMFSQFQNRPDRYILGSLLLGILGIGCLLPGYFVILTGALGSQVLVVLLGILLVIAGLVLCMILTFRYSLIVYLFLENPQMRVMEAYRKSAEMMRGNKGRLFYIYLSFIGWSILAMFSCGIGMLWVIPYMAQTNVQFYLDVKEEQNQ